MKNDLLIVGGTGRNVGKTEFVCRLIAQVAQQVPVYALKVSAVVPDEEIFHGSHMRGEESSGPIEETRLSGNKDTIRMLRAGASKVFYLKAEQAAILDGFNAFYSLVPSGAAVICESNSLGEVVTPALHIVVKSREGKIKDRAIPLLNTADMVIVSDGISGFAELACITYEEKTGWTRQ